MEYQPLKYIFQPSPKADAHTLLLLHGTGGDERDLLPLANQFDPTAHVLSVRGNVSEQGMPRFFRRLAMGVFDEIDVHFRTHELVHFLRDVAVKEGFDADKVVALGFSNGANIAGSLLMLYPELLAGAVLFRPMLPLTDLRDGFNTSRQQPVFFSTGKTDSTVDPAANTKYVKLLTNNGYRVTRADVAAGHNLTQQDVILAAEWYRSNFAPA